MAVGDDECSKHNEQELDCVRGDEDPALAGREEAVEACEEEGPGAEGGNGCKCFYPANAFRGSDETETEVYRVAWCGCQKKLRYRLIEKRSAATRRSGYFYHSPVCMLTKEPQIKTAELSSKPVMT